MPIKSFRGLIVDNGQDKIILHTNTGSTGYRIKKFEVISETPGDTADESILKIYKVEQLDKEEKRAVDLPEQDLYLKEKDAIDKAKALGCDGAHIHEIDGETYYMPCKNMEDYTKLTGKKHTDENDTTLISYNDKRAPSEPAPKKDQIEGSKKNPKGSATGKSNNIKFNELNLLMGGTLVDDPFSSSISIFRFHNNVKLIKQICYNLLTT